MIEDVWNKYKFSMLMLSEVTYLIHSFEDIGVMGNFNYKFKVCEKWLIVVS